MAVFTGKVIEGSQRAAELGYPTINIELQDPNVSGIFAGRVYIKPNTFEAAVFVDPTRHLLEAHLLHFSGDMYGREVSIELVKKIRESEIFTDDDALKRAIGEDVQAVREYFDL